MQLERMEFEFSEAKKTSALPPDSIDTGIDVVGADLRKGVLTVDFVYTASYRPHGSYIRLSGKAGFSGPDVKAAHAEWTKTKRITGSAGEAMVNAISYSASINAIFIARIFNLMPPVVPPTIRLK